MRSTWILGALLAAGLAVMTIAAEQARLRRDIPAEGVRRLTMELQVGAAELKLASHKGPPLVRLDIGHSAGQAPRIDFSKNGGEGHLSVRSSHEDGAGFSILGGRKNQPLKDAWAISISRDQPCVLDVEFGLGSGSADFGGLNLEELKFATGLSDVELNFSLPCAGTARRVELATGLGSMEVRGLSNLRMGQLQFAGGLGSAVLDFSGAFRQNLEVALDVGMGSLDLKVPENMGVKIRHDDNFLSSHEFDRLERTSSDTWYSTNWRDGPGNLSFQLSVGMGSVDLEWIGGKKK
jgi:hypothetical protein